jgi:hypothetical protein
MFRRGTSGGATPRTRYAGKETAHQYGRRMAREGAKADRESVRRRRERQPTMAGRLESDLFDVIDTLRGRKKKRARKRRDEGTRKAASGNVRPSTQRGYTPRQIELGYDLD